MRDKRILIVEDESIVAMEIESRLRKLGYGITGVVSRGEEVLEAVRKNSPDLILMDIKLAGGMDGIDAASEVRAQVDVPVVFLTAFADEGTVQKAKLAGPHGYVLKPFEEADLRLAIEIALYKHDLEKKLRESEERYRDLFESASDLIQIVSPDGRFLFVNRSWRETLGYREEEVSRLTLFDVIEPDCTGHCRDTFGRVLSEGRLDSIETVFRTRDGRKVILEGSANCKYEQGGEASVRCIFRDVTERKKAEEELKAAMRKAEDERMKTEAIIAAIGDGISIQDTDFRVLYQNAIHKELIGDHSGEYCYKAYEGRGEICEGCPVAMSFRDGRNHTVVRSGENERGPVHVEITTSPLRDSSGRIIAGIEVARDITKRILMQAEAQKNLDIQYAIRTLLQASIEKTTLDEILDAALGIILDIRWLALQAQGAIFVVEEGAKKLVLKSHRGLDTQMLLLCSKVPFGTCLCGRAAVTQEIQFAERVDERHEIIYEGMLPHGHYTVPIVSTGKTLGVVVLYPGRATGGTRRRRSSFRRSPTRLPASSSGSAPKKKKAGSSWS